MFEGRKIHLGKELDENLKYHGNSASRAQQYYAGGMTQGVGDHIGKDSEVAERPTMVFGDEALALRLGLEVGGEPTLDEITRVALGEHAQTGETLLSKSARPDRISYHDFAVSAPPSTSVLLADLRRRGDEDEAQWLIKTWEESSLAGMAAAQELALLGRRSKKHKGQNVTFQVPAKIMGFLDTHVSARPVQGFTDVELHNHMRVLAVVEGEDGKLGALADWDLYRHSPVFSNVTNAHFRQALEQRGYRTKTRRMGTKVGFDSFELAAVPEAVLEAMTGSRTRIINKLTAEQALTNQAKKLAELQDKARLSGSPTPTELTHAQKVSAQPSKRQQRAIAQRTKETKEDMTRDALIQHWTSRLDTAGCEPILAGAPRQLSSARKESSIRALMARALNPNPSLTRRDKQVISGKVGLLSSASMWNNTDLYAFVAHEAPKLHLSWEEVQAAVERIRREAVVLEHPLTLAPCYTTEATIAGELRTTKTLLALSEDFGVNISPRYVEQSIALTEKRLGSPLSDDQKLVVRSMAESRRFAMVIGYAGAGKTTATDPFVMAASKAVSRAAKNSGYEIVGTAVSGSATQTLKGEIGAPCFNLQDLWVRYQNGKLQDDRGNRITLSKNSIIIADEFSLIGSDGWSKLASICEETGCALRAIGDSAQSGALGSGHFSSFLETKLPTSVLQTNFRQSNPAEAAASLLLRQGNGVGFLEAKQQLGLLHISDSSDLSVTDAVNTWDNSLQHPADVRKNLLSSDLNAVVRDLNLAARAKLLEKGWLDPARSVVVGEDQYCVGERIQFMSGHSLMIPRLDEHGQEMMRPDGSVALTKFKVPRRCMGQITAIKRDGTITVETDGSDKIPTRTVRVSADQAEKELAYSYALTTFSAQGGTWENAYEVWISSRLSGRQSSYPAQTRSKIATHVFTPRKEGSVEEQNMPKDLDPPAPETDQEVIERLGKSVSRDLHKPITLDFFSEHAEALADRLAAQHQALHTTTWQADSPATTNQISLLQALGVEVETDLSWLQASIAIDCKQHGLPGSTAESFLITNGTDPKMAKARVDAELEKAGLDLERAEHNASPQLLMVADRQIASYRQAKPSITAEEVASHRRRLVAQLVREEASQKASTSDITKNQAKGYSR